MYLEDGSSVLQTLASSYVCFIVREFGDSEKFALECVVSHSTD